MQFTENGFIDFSESVAFLIVAQVKLVNPVDDLTQQNAVFHIVVGVRERGLHNRLLNRRFRRDMNAGNQDVSARVLDVHAFQYGKQRIVDEIQKFVSRHSVSAAIVRPVFPAARLRDNGLVIRFS